MNKYINAIEQLSNPFSTGYTDEYSDDHLYFNVIGFFAGIIFILVLLGIYIIRSHSFTSSDAIGSVGSGWNIPFLSRGKKGSPEDWNIIKKNDERPDVEKKFLDSKKDKDKQDTHIPDKPDKPDNPDKPDKPEESKEQKKK